MDREQARALVDEFLKDHTREGDRLFHAGFLAGCHAAETGAARDELARRERVRKGAAGAPPARAYASPSTLTDAALRKRIAVAEEVQKAVKEMRDEVPVAPPKFKRSMVTRMKFAAACLAAGVEFVTIGDGERQRPAFFSRKTREQVEWGMVPESVRAFL